MKLTKPKVDGMQISDKDKKLLYIVGIIGVLFLGYRFLISPKIAAIKTIKVEYGTVKDKRDALKSAYENIDTLRKETDDIKYNEQRMQIRVPGFDSVPYSLSLLFANADRTGVSISTVACEAPANMSPAECMSGNGTGGADNNVSGNKYVVKNSFAVSASGEFNKVFGLLKSIEESERKFSLDNVALREGKVGDISATFRVTAISYVDKNNEIQCPYEIPEYAGRANIFDVAPNGGTESDSTYYTPEYHMNINYSSYAGPKVIFMENGRFDTELCCDSANEIQGSLVIEGNDKNLKATCKLDKSSKIINSKIDLKGNTIRMTVLSTPRLPDDVLKLILSVENKTKYNLEITVVNDDQFNPKFNLKEPKDNVLVKGVNR